MQEAVMVSLFFPADHDGYRRLAGLNNWLQANHLPLLGLVDFPTEQAFKGLLVPEARALVLISSEQLETAWSALSVFKNTTDWPHARIRWKPLMSSLGGGSRELILKIDASR